MQKIGFGGGCHWCTEAVFASLRGVGKVLQGWIRGDHPDAITYSEAVIVQYDPSVIPLDVLVEMHLRTHSATTRHSMRTKYRSAIYTFNDADFKVARMILDQKQSLFDKPIITRVYPFKRFKSNQESYLNYYQKYKEGAFCQRYIDPKLEMLKREYSTYVDTDNL